jgi:hypothetical protein
LGQATGALQKIAEGKNQVLSENLESAQGRFLLALEQFRQGAAALDQSNVLVRALVATLPAGRDAQNLLKTGEAGSEAAVHLTKFAMALKALKLDARGVTSSSGSGFESLHTEFVASLESLESAVAAVEAVHSQSVPQDKQAAFEKARDELRNLTFGMRTLGKSLQLFEALSDGHKHVLVLLQNSNELRPSGGFVGTYGAFDLQNGEITAQKVSSIYDLDGQLKSNYVPPLPLFAVNNRWYMRDSNWFASFPESAETMLGFYEEEVGRTPDLVVAVTPQLVTRLLAITGPISVPGYNLSLDSDNFIEVTQVETSVYYDKKENKPKKMLAEFLPVFLTSLSNVPHTRLPDLLSAVTESFQAKDIQFYSRDRQVAGILQDLGFDGRIQQSSRDYLSIVSANLGGTKTDLAMEQQVTLDSTIDGDGSVTNTLRIHRHNPLPHVEGLQNKDFMRIYVPLGSKLISSKGFSYVNLDAKYATAGQVHPKVAVWEGAAVKQVDSGTLVGEEAGKTFFGNWVNLEGGQRQTIELVYKLPFHLEVLDRHSITVQKQPGAISFPVNYTLAFSGRSLVWASEQAQAGSVFVKEFMVDRDRFAGVVLEKAE